MRGNYTLPVFCDVLAPSPASPWTKGWSPKQPAVPMYAQHEKPRHSEWKASAGNVFWCEECWGLRKASVVHNLRPRFFQVPYMSDLPAFPDIPCKYQKDSQQVGQVELFILLSRNRCRRKRGQKKLAAHRVMWQTLCEPFGISTQIINHVHLGYYFLYNIIGVLMWVYKPNYSFATNTKYPFETLVLYWSYSFGGPKEFNSLSGLAWAM